MSHSIKTNTERAVGHLDAALGALLAARVELGVLVEELPVPDEAIDAALAGDEGYQEARGQLRDAVQALLALAPEGEHRRLVLAVEEVANHLVVVAVGVGWKVGVTAGSRKVV